MVISQNGWSRLKDVGWGRRWAAAEWNPRCARSPRSTISSSLSKISKNVSLPSWCSLSSWYHYFHNRHHRHRSREWESLRNDALSSKVDSQPPRHCQGSHKTHLEHSHKHKHILRGETLRHKQSTSGTHLDTLRHKQKHIRRHSDTKTNTSEDTDTNKNTKAHWETK